MSITVFGSINLDLTVSVEQMPEPGVTSHATGFLKGLGGKGANQAVAATRLAKSKVRFVAAVGADAFGDSLKASLVALGVDTDDLVTMAEHDSGIALIHVDSTSQNTITVVGGANMAWPSDGPDAACFDGCKVALFQLETPKDATIAAMRKARAAGATVILDPAPIASTGMDALLAEADIITPNETEAAGLSGTKPTSFNEALEVARALCQRGPQTVIVKLGSKGLVYACKDGRSGQLEPFRVNAIDTVAAGDSFNGGLAAALAEGMELEAALRFASAAGALATTRKGASEAVPSRDATDRLLLST
ncbi:ribokinase [uncultured Cohaesibacter sp.]|uniref:ribokinase n=1 Tax=uncultured Cohaesibacter sp. TaxID=1002546 RepID=UPI00292EAA97|nr:ribokinase [uncultured Cohaesibacter sp.]